MTRCDGIEGGLRLAAADVCAGINFLAALQDLSDDFSARAAREESDDRVSEEAADLIYHLAVLLRGRGLSLADAERVLDGRRGR